LLKLVKKNIFLPKYGRKYLQIAKFSRKKIVGGEIWAEIFFYGEILVEIMALFILFFIYFSMRKTLFNCDWPKKFDFFANSWEISTNFVLCFAQNDGFSDCIDSMANITQYEI